MKKIQIILTTAGFVFLMSLSFNVAIAARTVPGQVPKLQPLQPAPFDTAPDLSHNIENQGQVAPNLPIPDTSAANQAARGALLDQAKNGSFLSLLWILIPLVVVLGWLIYKILRNTAKDKES